MCYTGKCPYEISYGDYLGDCTLDFKDSLPMDAFCTNEPCPDNWGTPFLAKEFEAEMERIKIISQKEGRFRILDLSE